MTGMWVVSENATGWSDESMRFATFTEANKFIEDNEDPERDKTFGKRWESDSPHPLNQHALGQVLRDGAWLDYVRDTPEVAIRWAMREPAGTARVVDWISRDVMWP